MAFLSDTAIFTFLGISISTSNYEENQFKFIFGVLLLCIISRAIHVYPILTMVSISSLF